MNSQASSSSMIAPDAASSSVPPQNSHRFVTPGFRFHPTEQELILYYLGRKAFGEPLYTNVVPDIDIYKFEPHEVPGKVGGDIEWYFFSKLDKKYETGGRVNRSTGRGYWKVTGPEYKIKYGSQVIGEKRFLVYYTRHLKMARRTDWVMHEYRLTDASLQVAQARDVYALYRLFWKGNSDSDPIPNGPAPVAAEEGEQVHDDNVVLADAALQPLDEKNIVTTLAGDALEAAPAAYALVLHKEAAPLETLDLLTNFNGEGLYEHSKETSSAREDTPTRPVKRPRIAEANSPRNLSPRAQEPNSSNSVARAIPSLMLSLACPVSGTAPVQQEQRQIATPQPVPQQAVEPPQTTTVQTPPAIPITIERATVKRETSEDQCVKDV